MRRFVYVAPELVTSLMKHGMNRAECMEHVPADLSLVDVVMVRRSGAELVKVVFESASWAEGTPEEWAPMFRRFAPRRGKGA